jgi:hypothetical protein
MITRDQKILFAILAVFLAVIFFRFGTLLYFPGADDLLQKENLAKVQPKETLRQIFTAPKNNFAKVELILRTPGPKPGDAVEMKILDESCQKIISAGNLNSSFLSSNNLYEFAFTAISDSENKKYCLEAKFSPQKDTSKALNFFYTAVPGANFQNITAGQNFENQSLSMRLVYKNSNIFGDLSELNQRVSQYKPWFLKHYFFSAIAFGFVILSIILIAIFILL